MVQRSQVESLLTRHVSGLVDFEGWKALESGQASREEYERFLFNVIRTHLRSPQVLAFLYALAPPEAADNLAHNMLEELGIEEESGVAHPSLLRNLATGAGLGDRLPELEAAAQESLRQVICEPILYGTLREVGLASLVEVVAFEFMLLARGESHRAGPGAVASRSPRKRSSGSRTTRRSTSATPRRASRTCSATSATTSSATRMRSRSATWHCARTSSSSATSASRRSPGPAGRAA